MYWFYMAHDKDYSLWIRNAQISEFLKFLVTFFNFFKHFIYLH